MSIGGYGTHDLKDSDTGELLYTLISDSLDLDAYNGQRVTIYGTALDYREHSNGVNVYHVESLDGTGGATSPVEDNGSVDDTDDMEYSNGSVGETAGEEAAARESDSAGSAARSIAETAAERAGVQVLPSTGGLSFSLPVAGLLLAIGLIGFRLLRRS